MLRKYILITLFICISVSLTSCATSPGIKYLQRGEAAYQRQDYHEAFELLLASAKYDNTTAQYAVGYMYYYGIGTKRNLFEAVKWFQKAARYRDPEAIKALYMINHSGPPTFTFGKETTTH
jgi:TPR repeat protein